MRGYVDKCLCGHFVYDAMGMDWFCITDSVVIGVERALYRLSYGQTRRMLNDSCNDTNQSLVHPPGGVTYRVIRYWVKTNHPLVIIHRASCAKDHSFHINERMESVLVPISIEYKGWIVD
eukprot:448439_1